MKIENIEKVNVIRQILIVGKHIHQTEGLKGYFRGLLPEILRATLSTAIYFHILKELELFFKTKQAISDDQYSSFISSAIARMAAAYFTNPLSVVASRIEVPGFHVYKNMFDGIKKIYKYEGIGQFMKGSWTSSAKEGPFAGTYYVLYKNIKQMFKDSNIHYTQVSMISGMVSGIVATTVSHPFEIIRARLQIMSKFEKNPAYQYSGIFDAFRKIYIYEGFTGYYRGLAPRLVRKPLANTLTFGIFEFFHNTFNYTKW
ncbi:mitochondrial carrier protein, putative [Ichthyophthirius multifiliis]|uniref:Mitochondrial carrier protein, putative n=1 Tax=Ichthyophthirius multifiliis TaxID=5932 RepID=G0QN51_ICHMU|nr:mitochondrial carrier protein, putative [Ichthyophthirius multifiliis]EGR33353.1 mitochondrial carrier protein, putative [Ichthyophthirius multifiliis]|eukprot:XP_004037339.1 mitochondrial carrier protein, putative [Ichthyophthirius multifiliis]